jgi:transcription elongation factor Elf1
MAKVEKEEKRMYAVGDRVEKQCLICDLERGHVVVSLTKRGNVSRVTCPVCGTRGSFKSAALLTGTRSASKVGAEYDSKRTYRTGQTMTHPTFGPGEVTAIIEPKKIDVLFPDRLRRLIHARV